MLEEAPEQRERRGSSRTARARRAAGSRCGARPGRSARRPATPRRAPSMTCSVDQVVHLQLDAAGRSGLCERATRVDLVEDPLAQVERRDEQLAVAAHAGEAGQVVEEVGDVGRDVRPAGEQPEVGVQPRRPGVVVARPDVGVAADAARPRGARRGRSLACVFMLGEAVHDVHAGALERARPADVALLVEARLELDQDDGLLALLGGADQARHDRRVARRAVDRVLDREHVRVVDGLAGSKRSTDVVEVVVGVVDEEVALAHGSAKMSRASLARRRSRGCVTPDHGRVVQLGAVEPRRAGRGRRRSSRPSIAYT